MWFAICLYGKRKTIRTKFQTPFLLILLLGTDVLAKLRFKVSSKDFSAMLELSARL